MPPKKGKKLQREPRGGPDGLHDDSDGVAETEIALLVNGTPLARQEINGKIYVEVPGPGTEFSVRVRTPARAVDATGIRLTIDGCAPPHWYRGRTEKIVDSFPVDKDWGRKLTFGAPDGNAFALGPNDGRSAGGAGIGTVRVRIFKTQKVPRRWQTAEAYKYSNTAALTKPRVEQCGDDEGLMLKTTAELGNPTPNPRPLNGQWVDTECPMHNPIKDIVFHYRTKAQIAGIPTDDPKPEVKQEGEVKLEGKAKRKRAGDEAGCAIQLD
jgi:hypothetical protein